MVLVISVAERDWSSNQNAKQVLNAPILWYKSFVNPDTFPKRKQQNVTHVHQELRQVFKNLFLSQKNQFKIYSKCENHGTSSPETCSAGYECSNPAAPTMCLVWFKIGLHIYRDLIVDSRAFLKPK